MAPGPSITQQGLLLQIEFPVDRKKFLGLATINSALNLVCMEIQNITKRSEVSNQPLNLNEKFNDFL